MLNGLRKAAQYEHTPRGKFAGIFCRRIVMRRKRAVAYRREMSGIFPRFLPSCGCGYS